MTPYRRVKEGTLTDEIVYLTADEETDYYISQATVPTDAKNKITNDEVIARYNGDNIVVNSKDIHFVDVAPSQIVSITTSCIPFLEHDDATRALMGSNMQRQAIPLLKTEAPIVGTGVEYIAARDSGSTIVCKADGEVEYADSKTITVKTKGGKDVYYLAI